MKLNPDCIRDILLIVEDTADFNSCPDYTHFFNNEDLTSKYSNKEIMYHIRQADLSGLLYKTKYFKIGFLIEDLTPEGHKFLNDIRNDNNWNKTKNIANQVGSFSLDTLKSVSSGVISNLINQHLGL